MKFCRTRSKPLFLFLLLPFLFLFSASLVPFFSGIEVSPLSLPFSLYSYSESSYRLTEPFHMTNSYGLFRRMTGIGGRPELIIKASMDGKHWEEYLLPYKPQVLSKAPQFNLPHQPRLDWQMWFAALTDLNHSYWFFTLLNKLFAGSQSALTLFEQVPFAKPKFIKVELYLYQFTTRGNDWWNRKYVKDWIPPITADEHLVKQWKKFRYPDPNKAPSLKIHPFHYLPIVEISSAIVLIKLIYHLI